MRSRSLLIVRAGDQSLHRVWRTEADPAFDLWISYYGSRRDHFEGDDSAFYEARTGLKWPVVADIMASRWDEIANRYDYVGFPDDDLLADARAWNGVFEAAHHLNLQLFHPALTADSFITWRWSRRRPRLYARICRTVDIMAPIFRIDALAKVRETFAANKSGWGFAALWASMLPYPFHRTGIIDRFPVKHTRRGGAGPLTALYRDAGIDPAADFRAICELTGTHPRAQKIFERIYRQPPTGDYAGIRRD